MTRIACGLFVGGLILLSGAPAKAQTDRSQGELPPNRSAQPNPGAGGPARDLLAQGTPGQANQANPGQANPGQANPGQANRTGGAPQGNPAAENSGTAQPTVASLTAEVTRLRQELSSLQQQVDRVSQNVTQSLQETKANKDALGELTDRINDELIKQQQILEAIAAADSQGQSILNLRSIMQKSPEFREELREVVNQSLGQLGRFVVTNKTASYQRIVVNRTEYGLRPGETLNLQVPVGTVTAQVPGRDASNWTVGPPNYEQSVDMVPPTQQTVMMPPVEPTVSYVETPAWVWPW